MIVTKIFNSPLENVTTNELIPKFADKEAVELVLKVQEREDVLGTVVHVATEKLLYEVQLARLVPSQWTY